MIASYIEDRIRRAPPTGVYIILGSTPVVAFGNAQVARVATLGLNPSRSEFIDNAGAFLEGDRRRLATHASLGINDLSSAPLQVVERVLDDCNQYFHRQPYRLWFDRLEHILKACGASYYDGTACHLDLVQWATDPIWAKLPSAVRKRLIADDAEFLAGQLRNEGIRLLLVNGAAVWRQLNAAMHQELVIERTDVISGLYRQPATFHFALLFGKIGVIAWSTNLQSSFGVTNLLRDELARHAAACFSKFNEDLRGSALRT